jgi:hypothetical protein
MKQKRVGSTKKEFEYTYVRGRKKNGILDVALLLFDNNFTNRKRILAF